MKIRCPACLAIIGHGDEERARTLAMQHRGVCIATERQYQAAIRKTAFDSVIGIGEHDRSSTLPARPTDER